MCPGGLGHETELLRQTRNCLPWVSPICLAQPSHDAPRTPYYLLLPGLCTSYPSTLNTPFFFFFFLLIHSSFLGSQLGFFPSRKPPWSPTVGSRPTLCAAGEFCDYLYDHTDHTVLYSPASLSHFPFTQRVPGKLGLCLFITTYPKCAKHGC